MEPDAESWVKSIGQHLFKEISVSVGGYTSDHYVDVSGIRVNIGGYYGELTDDEKQKRVKEKYEMALVWEEIAKCPPRQPTTTTTSTLVPNTRSSSKEDDMYVPLHHFFTNPSPQLLEDISGSQ